MVAGRLQEKKDYFYIVLSYTDKDGKRKQPWFKTGLRVRGNKKKEKSPQREARKEPRTRYCLGIICYNGWKGAKAP